ncbi:hypothetical protein QQ045_009608 [Rhodiola kirilowii]
MSTSRSASRRCVRITSSRPANSWSTTTAPPAPAPPANSIILLPHQWFERSRQLQQQPSSDTSTTASATDSTTKASPFDCNICLSQATEPVVTSCGHLYCWPCLYTWVRRTDSCAVCRGLLEPQYVFPIYGANGDDEGRDGCGLARKSGIPPRPSGRRIDRVDQD